MLSQLDEILLLFGQPGRFQVLIAFLLCCIQIPVIFPKILLTFYAETPPHRCLVQINVTTGTDLTDLLPLKNDESFSSCEMYKNPKDHAQGTRYCADGWEYMIPDKEWTIVSEWDLVCKKEYLANLLPFLLSGGSILGCLIFGSLADQFGRKRILFVTVIGNTCASIALHFSPNYVTFATLYTFIGVFTAGVQCVSFVLLLEMLPTPYQLKFCVILSLFWAVGELILTLLTWPVHHWRFLQLAVSVPGLICVSYFWLIPSSLVWQVARDNVGKAENELERLANYNGVCLAPSFRVKLKDYYSSVRSVGGTASKRMTLQSVCFYHKLNATTLVLFYVWFVVAMVNTTKVPQLIIMKDRSRQLRSFVSGFAHLGIIMLLYLVINRLGPKFAQAFLLIFGGLLCVGSFVLEIQVAPLFKPSRENNNLIILSSHVSATLGKELVRVTLPCLFFHSGKHFPTFLRASGVATCLLWAKIAEIVTPHINLMAGESNWFLGVAVGGILSILGGILSLTLPNVWDAPLPFVFARREKGKKRLSGGVGGCKALNPRWPYSQDNEFIYEKKDKKDKNGNCSSLGALTHSDSLGQSSPDKGLDYTVEGDAFLACLEQSESYNSVSVMVNENDNVSRKSATTSFEPVSGIVFDHVGNEAECRLTDLEDELMCVWESNRTRNVVKSHGSSPIHSNSSTSTHHHHNLHHSGGGGGGGGGFVSKDFQFFTRSKRNFAYEEDETVF